jgi:hypothetical protein
LQWKMETKMKPNEKQRTKPASPRPVLGLLGLSPSDQRGSLSLPQQKARARWRPSVAALIAGALATNRGLLERMKGGMYAPDKHHGEQYQVIFNGLFAATKEQIAALEMFAQVDWE